MLICLKVYEERLVFSGSKKEKLESV